MGHRSVEMLDDSKVTRTLRPEQRKLLIAGVLSLVLFVALLLGLASRHEAFSENATVYLEGTEVRVSTLILIAAVGDLQGESWRGDNIKFFLQHAYLTYPEYYYMLILNGCHRYKIADEILSQPNFEVVERENVCMDAGAWSHGLKIMDQRGKTFERYVYINNSVRGPFTPAWMPKDWDWIAAFSRPLSQKVKLVGTTVNCHDGVNNHLHVQSMVMVTDKVGNECCIRKAMDTPICDAEHPMTKFYIITNRELAFTRNILQAGYTVYPMMLAWNGLELSLNNAKGVEDRCTSDLSGGVYGDMYYDLSYGKDRISVHPLELMFYKTNRLHPAVVDSYTKWAGSGRYEEPLTILPDEDGVSCYRDGDPTTKD